MLDDLDGDPPVRDLAWPVRWAASGDLAAVVFGSGVEIGQCVDLVATTQQGGFRATPEFGTPELAFGQGERGREEREEVLRAAVDDDEFGEPRARGEYDVVADADGFVTVDVRTVSDDPTVETGA